MSQPRNPLSNFFATTAVVPLPIKGSSTMSPTLEEDGIGLCNNSSGYTAK
jgi:hypothetical protein